MGGELREGELREGDLMEGGRGWNWEADLAQLGERKTEVLEVPSSILGVGKTNCCLRGREVCAVCAVSV